MIARIGSFRSKVVGKRGIVIDGNYTTSPWKGFIDIAEVDLVNKIDGQNISDTPTILDGTSVRFTTIPKIKIIKGNIALIKYHPDLHKSGVVMGPTFLDEEDEGPITFTFEANEDLDFSQLPYVVRIYLEGQDR